MPLEDLDLVFEDESEDSKKKSDVLVEQEITFAVENTASEGGAAVAAKKKEADVRSLDEWKTQKQAELNPVSVPVAKINSVSKNEVVKKADTSQINNDLETNDIQKRLIIAEYKLEFFSELQSDLKLMDYQINQVLLKMHHKHPDLKGDILLIKKLLADFVTKKRK